MSECTCHEPAALANDHPDNHAGYCPRGPLYRCTKACSEGHTYREPCELAPDDLWLKVTILGTEVVFYTRSWSTDRYLIEPVTEKP
jgi:hypothetical protein